MEARMRSVHEVGKEMLKKIREELGLPPGVQGYVIWGKTPQELRKALERFLQEVPLTPSQARALRRLLPAVERQGLNLLAVLPWGEQVYFRGMRANLVETLKG